jgi:hypothetical protein
MATLKRSIEDFPEMLKIRPVVIDEDNTILAGNMRYRACMELGHEQVWCDRVRGLTAEEKREFVVKDNVTYGQWDDEVIEQHFKTDMMERWTGDATIDYGFLDEFISMDDELADRANDVVRSIAFHLPNLFYEVKDMDGALRGNGVDVGSVVVTALRLAVADGKG